MIVPIVRPMNTPAPGNHPTPASDPLWVTSQFSNKELDGEQVRVDWLGEEERWGIYRLQVVSYGHSHHIQNVHAILLAGTGTETFDFDQTDADLLHRTNESIHEYRFHARLDPGRSREQNPHLEKLVTERRLHKKRDLEDANHWLNPLDHVVKPIVVSHDTYTLPDEPEEA